MTRTFPQSGVDFYCGVLLIAVAALALWLVSDLDMGTAGEMGPAFFPAAVALVLAGIGVVMLIRGLALPGPALGAIDLRPLVSVLGSFLAFGLLISRAGLVAAIVAQVAVCHLAAREAKLIESTLMAAALAAFSAVVFVYLLGLPVRLWP